MKRVLLAAAVAASFLTPAAARAHFIFLVQKQHDGKDRVHVYFSEEAAPDNPELLKKLDGMVVNAVSAKGAAAPVALKADENSLTSEVPAGSPFTTSSFLYGVAARSESNKYLIIYHAKAGPVLGDPAWKSVDTSKMLEVDLIPAATRDGKIELTVLWKGQPVPKSEVAAVIPGIGPKKAETDDHGKVVFEKGEPGLFSARARVIQEGKGEHQGKAYDSTRHYGTVSFSTASVSGTKELAPLTPAVTSLGGAVVGDSLYVYGGNLGGAHSYSNKGQSHELRKIALNGQSGWETVAEGPALQGLAMVAHGGKLYRVGGFTAKNDEGKPNDLESQSSVACFDPAVGKWSDLPALPEARSSHDAAVLGDTLYVIGGWKLGGGEGDTQRGWHDTAWSLDLTSKKPEWKALAKPPFERRALAVAAYDGKLYAIGGMQKEGGPTTKSSIFDPETNAWYEGPALVGDDGMTGFGASAFATGGKLYVSTSKGNLQRLSADGKTWEIARELPTARFFHRMLPVDDSRFVMVGGANMDSGKFEQVEIVSVAE